VRNKIKLRAKLSFKCANVRVIFLRSFAENFSRFLF